MFQKRLAHSRTYLSILATLLISAHALGGEECDREFTSKAHPFPPDQNWVVKKNFILPEGKGAVYFKGGSVTESYLLKDEPFCIFKAKSTSNNPREFRSRTPQKMARTINIESMGFETKRVRREVYGVEVGKIEATIKDFNANGYSFSDKIPQLGSNGKVWELVFLRNETNYDQPSFIVSKDDKTVLKITCPHVKTYNELKAVFGDYLSGIECPVITVEEARKPDPSKVEGDAALKPSTLKDETADAAPEKGSTGSPSGQQTR